MCNSTTALPDLDPREASGCVVGTTHFVFDPTVFSQFHVFLLLEDGRR
jgi:hypothetical protein